MKTHSMLGAKMLHDLDNLQSSRCCKRPTRSPAGTTNAGMGAATRMD